MNILLSIHARACKPPIIEQTYQLQAGTTMRELLIDLTKQDEMPQKFGDAPGFDEFFIIINGVNAIVGGMLDAPLEEGDRVFILPAFAGG